MNIVWHMPTLKMHGCGLSQRALEIARRLVGMGQSITFAVDAVKTDITAESVAGMPLRRLAVEHRRPLHWCTQARNRRYAAEEIAGRLGTRWDAIISCQPEVAAACAASADRRPVVFVCGSTTLLHDAANEADRRRLPSLGRVPYAIDRRLKRGNERRAFHLADAVVFDSRQTRELVIAGYRVDAQKCRTIHGGCDPDRFRPATAEQRSRARRRLGLQQDAFIVVWTGRLSPEKNVRTLIEAVPRCRRRCDRVLIVGDGPLREELVALCRTCGADQRVQFVGEHADVRLFLHAADVFAFPSRCESFGGSLVEALACGLPAVGLRPDGRTIRNANIEVIEEGGCGLLVDGLDPARFAEALDRSAGDRGMRERLGTAGRQWAAERFTWSAAANEMWQILDQLARALSAGHSRPAVQPSPVTALERAC